MLNALIVKWEAAHGPKKTDIILETVGLTRPGASTETAQPMDNGPMPESEEANFTQADNENPYNGIEEDDNVNPME